MYEKGSSVPFGTLLGHLKHYLKHLFSNVVIFGEKRENKPDTFSDTPELPDTLPEIVLVTFYLFLKRLYKTTVAHHNARNMNVHTNLARMCLSCQSPGRHDAPATLVMATELHRSDQPQLHEHRSEPLKSGPRIGRES